MAQRKEHVKLSVQEEDGGDGAMKIEGESKGETEGEEGIEKLSCAARTWENSLSSTMDRANHLKGDLMISR